jgi:SAM-dependent methyltransferase
MSDCVACGSNEVSERLRVREFMFGTGESFPYDVCASCGSVRLAEVPTDLSPYYPEDYYSVDLDPERILGRPPVRQFTATMASSVLFGSGRAANAARAMIARRQFHTLLSLLGSVRAAGLPRGRQTSVLDVGCGSGVLLYALALGGMTSVTGVDPFAPGDRVLDNGATILRRDLAEVEGTFDLVMFHHSFEHVPDPGASLEQALARLGPQGRILVRMPTASSDAFDHYREGWVQLDAPRHLTVFSREGMAQLSAAHGLRVVATHDDSTSFQFWGSEQALLGIPFNAANSHFANPKGSPFTTDQVRIWERESSRLNAIGRGDQSAWVLARGDEA